MPSIRASNEALSRAWNAHESARSVLFSMLDDSEDDNPVILDVEKKRGGFEFQVKRALRNRNIFSRLSHQFSRDDNDPVISRRKRLEKYVELNTEKYSSTTKRRTLAADTSSIMRYAFKNPIQSDQKTIEAGPSSSTTSQPAALDHPRFTWTLRFKKLDITHVDIWTELKFTEVGFQKWWRRRYSGLVPLDSDGWSDMKRLARRVVIQILEYVGSSVLNDSRHIVHLKMLSERAREITLYQIILCYNVSSQWLADLEELFEYSAPIIYLFSEVVKASALVPPNAIAENLRIEKQLRDLNPYVRALRDRCYLLGDKIGFDVYQYKEEFSRGAIFDFDVEDNLNATKQNDFIKLDRRLAGNTKREYLNRISSIGQKQLKVKETVRHAASQCENVWEASSSTVKLESKGCGHFLVLEEIGLKCVDDISFESRRLKGSGGYADVFEMKCSNKTITSVAVKIYRPGPRSATRLEREARIWSKIHHKYISPLLGFVTFNSLHTPQPCLVSELYHTDLKQLVRDHRKASVMYDKQPLTEERKLKFLRDIVLGLDFMHAMGVAHGDLRAANVLVTNNLIDDLSCYAVLNDFGMAEYDDDDISHALDTRDLSSVNQRTNDYWLAPELIEGSPPREGSSARVSKAGDVYAFGVVFLEVIYERNPYDGSLYNIAYAKSIGELPAKKGELEPQNDSHWSLMQRCWEKVEKRWNIVETACELLTILDKVLPSTPADWVQRSTGLPDGFQYIL